MNSISFSDGKHIIIEMTTVFKTTLGPILALSKIFGLTNISYVFESGELLILSIHSIYYYSFLELTRMIVLLILTYLVYIEESYYVVNFRLVKFWIFIIAARLSEIWTIKLINGIIQFDQKLALLSPAFPVHQHSISKKKWNIILTSLFVYFVVYELYDIYLWPPNTFDINTFLLFFFGMPYIIDYVVIITVCFYLSNIGYRFQILNDFWMCLPRGLVSVSSEWTNSELVMLIESIRLLHAELSQLFKIFSWSYGTLLLLFFVCCIIDIIYLIYLMIKLENVIRHVPFHMLNIQIIIFLMSVILAASWINEKKIKIVSYLRLIPISKLPVEVKIQIKMFLYQISLLESDEITAFGFFNINLNLVISIVTLLMTGFSTLIQMKDHPIILAMVNNTHIYHSNWENVYASNYSKNGTSH